MDFEELPEDIQEQINMLKHGAQTIQSDVWDALESAKDLKEFQLQVDNCMDEIISEAQGVCMTLGTGKESENDIALRVEALKGTSKLVKEPAPGIVYKNVNVWIGTKRMKEGLIRFKVENSWLDSNSLAGSEVRMVKWDGSQWAQIETAEKTKDDTYTYYEAKTDTFSVFAITGLKGGVTVPTATPAGVVTETPVKPTGTATPAPAPTKKVPGFEFVLVVAALCSVYLFGRKRR